MYTYLHLKRMKEYWINRVKSLFPLPMPIHMSCSCGTIIPMKNRLLWWKICHWWSVDLYLQQIVQSIIAKHCASWIFYVVHVTETPLHNSCAHRNCQHDFYKRQEMDHVLWLAYEKIPVDYFRLRCSQSLTYTGLKV